MAQPAQDEIRNRLLRVLTEEGFSAVRPHLEPFALNLRDPLNEPDQPARFVYFLDQGLGSITLGPEPATGVEVGMAGREGLVGTCIVLGAGQSPHHSFIQMPSTGWRIAEAALTEAMDANPELRHLLLRFVHVFMTQVSSTAQSNADYTVEERLARWILMCHDRADSDQIAITHEFMALMLGVRRPGVTVATHMLEGDGMIRATRGLVTVLDREKLKRRANGSYGMAESEYERLIGTLDRSAGSNLVRFPSGSALGGPGPH